MAAVWGGIARFFGEGIPPQEKMIGINTAPGPMLETDAAVCTMSVAVSPRTKKSVPGHGIRRHLLVTTACLQLPASTYLALLPSWLSPSPRRRRRRRRRSTSSPEINVRTRHDVGLRVAPPTRIASHRIAMNGNLGRGERPCPVSSSRPAPSK